MPLVQAVLWVTRASFILSLLHNEQLPGTGCLQQGFCPPGTGGMCVALTIAYTDTKEADSGLGLKGRQGAQSDPV